MRWIQDPKRVTVPGSGSLDVVMQLQDRPYRELTIWVRPATSRVPGDGLPPVARNFSSEVFFGPTSQAAAAARVNDEAYMAYDPGSTGRIWPANNPNSNWARNERMRVKGFPVTVRFVNAAAAALVLDCEFDAMTIGS